MSASFLRCTVTGVVLVGLVTVGAGSASAQSSQGLLGVSSLTRDVSFTANVDNPFATASGELTASINPRPKATFMATQGGAANEDSGIAFGVLGMITRTSWRVDDVEDFIDPDNKTGWGAGLWVGGNRNGRIGFVGEFIYLVRGDDEFKTTAVQIPAVFHINFGSRDRNRVGGYVVAGPSFTVNLKQESYGVDISDDFNGADIGVIGGLGVEFFRIGIEGRGNWGLRNINSDGDVIDTKTFTFELLGKFAFN
jgi:hypothetical protein